MKRGMSAEQSVVISPTTIPNPVVTIASQATLANGALARMASRMASEIWSATLSGWPSVTDSDVNSDVAAMAKSSTESPAPARTSQHVRAGPQAPGSYLWDAKMLAQFQVVDPRVTEQLRAALRQQQCRGYTGGLHHRVEVLALHLPGRRRNGDRTQDDDARSLAQPLVVRKHLVMQRQLQGSRDQLGEVGLLDVVLAAAHQADGEDPLGAIVHGDVQRRVVDDAAVEVLALADSHGRKQSRNRSGGEQSWGELA